MDCARRLVTLRFVRRTAGCLLALWLCLHLGATGIQAQSGPVPRGGGTVHLYLVPPVPGGVRFLTHVVEIAAVPGDGFDTAFHTVATYRIHNAQSASLELTLNLLSGAGETPGTLSHEPDNVRLTLNDRPLAWSGDGPPQVALTLAADERAELVLRYTVRDAHHLFPQIHYDTTPLAGWGMPPDSMRISVFPGFTPTTANLHTLRPTGSEFQDQEVRWHFENALPPTPPNLHFVHAALRTSIQHARTAGDWLTLGDHFHVLYIAPETPEASRALMFDQALAAYLKAGDQNPSRHHLGLARLYRTRIPSDPGGVNPSYLDLALHHGQLALLHLDPDQEAQRREVVRWLMEGLETRVELAAQREDWTTVNEALDMIRSLPADWIEPSRIEALQDSARLRQALRLIEEGAIEDAAELVDLDLTAAASGLDPALGPLFTGMNGEIRVDPDRLWLRLDGYLAPGQESRLDEALAFLAFHAQAADQPLRWSETEPAADQPQALRIEMEVRDPDQAHSLASALRPDAEWVVLRQILSMPWPRETRRPNPLAVERELEYQLSLQSVFELWEAKSEALARQAAAEASVSQNTSAERIRQYHLVRTSAQWSDLVQNTWIALSFTPETVSGTAPQRPLASASQPTVRLSTMQRSPRMPVLVLGGLGLLAAALGIGWMLTQTPPGRTGAMPSST